MYIIYKYIIKLKVKPKVLLGDAVRNLYFQFFFMT